MSRIRVTTAAIGVAACAAALVAAVAGASGSAAPSSLNLVAVDLPKTEVYVDNGKKGESPGDVILFRERLHRGTRSGPVVGRTEVMCTFVNEQGSRCAGTVILGNGTLEAAGRVVFASATVRLPVVGGTKAYAGARGEVRFVDIADTATRYEITLKD